MSCSIHLKITRLKCYNPQSCYKNQYALPRMPIYRPERQKSRSFDLLFCIICNCSEPSKIFKNDYSCLHECRHFYNILFGGYATPRKHLVFLRLALNSHIIYIYCITYQIVRKIKFYFPIST